jgi:hypothetical protein
LTMFMGTGICSVPAPPLKTTKKFLPHSEREAEPGSEAHYGTVQPLQDNES